LSPAFFAFYHRHKDLLKRIDLSCALPLDNLDMTAPIGIELGAAKAMGPKQIELRFNGMDVFEKPIAPAAHVGTIQMFYSSPKLWSSKVLSSWLMRYLMMFLPELPLCLGYCRCCVSFAGRSIR
jgi:hypothetical protein